MFGWRITKYNPMYRDEMGRYTLDEWTSHSDIGDTFQDQKFVFEDYIKVEDAYVETIGQFLSEAGLEYLEVTHIADFTDSETVLKLAGDVVGPGFSLKDHERVSGAKLKAVCRLCLRELYGCQLTRENQFYVHFGYDYYIYIGSISPSISSINFARSRGLYVEEMPSPYLPEDDED